MILMSNFYELMVSNYTSPGGPLILLHGIMIQNILIVMGLHVIIISR